jgi:hypothetical protein
MYIGIVVLLVLGYFARYLSVKSICWIVGVLTAISLFYDFGVHGNQLQPYIILTLCGGLLYLVWLSLVSYFQDTIATFLVVLIGGDVLIGYLMNQLATGLHI